MLAWEIAIVVCELPRRSFGSNSRPIRKRNRTTPILDRIPSSGTISGGSRKAEPAGQSAPSSEGPSISPAIVSPITGGWLR
jgi:hypothetical protein